MWEGVGAGQPGTEKTGARNGVTRARSRTLPSVSFPLKVTRVPNVGEM